jgi:hypothetical protein
MVAPMAEEEIPLYNNGELSYDEVVKQDPEPYIVKLLGLAHKSVWLSSCLAPEFYNREKIIQAFLNASNRVNDFRILLDPSVDWGKRKQEITWIDKLLKSNQLSVKQSTISIPHWLLIDNTHFRLEKEHAGADLSETSNLILYNVGIQKSFEPAKLITTTVLSNFELWWTNGIVLK